MALLPSVPSTHHYHHSSPHHSFIPGLKLSFSASPSHRSLLFLFLDCLHGFFGLFTDTSEPICFYFFILSRGTITLTQSINQSIRKPRPSRPCIMTVRIDHGLCVVLHSKNTLPMPTNVVAANSLSAYRQLLKRFYSSIHIVISSTDIIQLVVLAPLSHCKKIY